MGEGSKGGTIAGFQNRGVGPEPRNVVDSKQKLEKNKETDSPAVLPERRETYRL